MAADETHAAAVAARVRFPGRPVRQGDVVRGNEDRTAVPDQGRVAASVRNAKLQADSWTRTAPPAGPRNQPTASA